MTQPLIDYYRCPAEFVHFTPSPALGDDPGFFRFGGRSTCYGRCAGPVEPCVGPNELPDATTLVDRLDHTITLPFDPAEVIDNLRMERYLGNNGGASGNGSAVKALIRKAYYLARPALPVNIRKHLQKYYLRGWEKIPFPSWPIDNTVDRLCADLMTLCIQANRGEAIPFVWFWPEGYPSCAILTHDIEHEPGRAFCNTLMDLNDDAGIKSSFQVIPEERYRVTDSFLESIRARGFEVNVHDLNHDGHLFDNRELFLRRAEKINRYAKQYGALGFRTGILYRNQDWFPALDFNYEMSVPSAAHLEPQKGGCCTVMPYFIGKMVELPLTATQDYSLLHIIGRYSLDLWKREIEEIASSHGLISINVHPDYIIEDRARSLYRDLLRHISALRDQGKLWVPLPREAARWWRERSQLQVVRNGEGWKIVGPGAERARIAFARAGANGLEYTLQEVPCPATP